MMVINKIKLLIKSIKYNWNAMQFSVSHIRKIKFVIKIQINCCDDNIKYNSPILISAKLYFVANTDDISQFYYGE